MVTSARWLEITFELAFHFYQYNRYKWLRCRYVEVVGRGSSVNNQLFTFKDDGTTTATAWYRYVNDFHPCEKCWIERGVVVSKSSHFHE